MDMTNVTKEFLDALEAVWDKVCADPSLTTADMADEMADAYDMLPIFKGTSFSQRIREAKHDEQLLMQVTDDASEYVRAITNRS
jgi:hypothetical protein